MGNRNKKCDEMQSIMRVFKIRTNVYFLTDFILKKEKRKQYKLKDLLYQSEACISLEIEIYRLEIDIDVQNS